MVTVFIGQRGTGKSSLLKRMSEYLKGIPHVCYDLDTEIEIRESKKITDIFSNYGEEAFRQLERKYFKNLIDEGVGLHLKLSSSQIFIAVGGGFDVSNLPSDCRVVSLLRASDSLGRIFLDRPILEPKLSPLEEFFKRYETRKLSFQNVAWEEYLIPEGLNAPSSTEKEILVENPKNVGGVLTLLPQHFNSKLGFQFFISRRLEWELDFFEIRDDLLSEKEIEEALNYIPKEKVLLARREIKKFEDKFLNELEAQITLIDYDRECISNSEITSVSGNCKKIISIHYFREKENLSLLLKNMEAYEEKGFHVKLAVEINNFTELILGHHWQMKNQMQRSFLPRSRDGRWLWYRLWKGRSQRINFFREGTGSAPDQPSLYQWLQRIQTGNFFAALLGFPVQHSLTPHYQSSFFEKRDMSVLPISIHEEEFTQAFDFLSEIGLLAAAVTSPLKLVAYDNCQNTTSLAQKYKSVNTMVRNKAGQWLGHNTDEEGLITLKDKAKKIIYAGREEEAIILDDSLNEEKIAIWGGGGTLPLLRNIFSNAEFFSAQTGMSREGKDLSLWMPEIVVWAGGKLKEEGIQSPPRHWQPRLIVDLNYREDSGGRELALKLGSAYISGEIMFYAQANAQQIFWQSQL